MFLGLFLLLLFWHGECAFKDHMLSRLTAGNQVSKFRYHVTQCIFCCFLQQVDSSLCHQSRLALVGKCNVGPCPITFGKEDLASPVTDDLESVFWKLENLLRSSGEILVVLPPSWID